MNDQLEHSDSKSARILELYKFHSQQATELSNRRTTTNRFFILLLSGIAVAYTTLFQKDDQSQLLPFLTSGLEYLPLTFGFIGLTLSWVWLFSIESNLSITTRKYKVLKNMERHLDYEYFTNEWAFLGIEKKDKTYRSLAITEIITPIIFIIILTILYILSLLYLSIPTNLLFIMYPYQVFPFLLYHPNRLFYLLSFIFWYIPIIPLPIYIYHLFMSISYKRRRDLLSKLKIFK